MKNLATTILLLIFTTTLLAQAQTDTLIDCAKAANKKGKMVYLKSFQTKLNSHNASKKWPLMLNSGVKYRFFLCENGKDKPENIELVLFDNAHPLNAPYATTKRKGSFYFECNKSGTYYILIKYKSDVQKKDLVDATAVLFFIKKHKG
jgi:hypothetical protein